MKRSLVFMLLLMLFASACNNDGGQGDNGQYSGVTVTFNISLAEEEKDTVQDLIDQFTAETGATVNITSVTSQDLPAKLEVDVGAGRPTIHLFAQDNLSLRVLVDKELVQGLDDVEVPDNVIEAMIPDAYNGTQYFLPFRPNVQVVYVNKERAESAGITSLPKTTDELRTAAQKMKAEAGQAKLTLSLSEEPGGAPAGVTLSEFIVSFGGDPRILNDAGSVAAYEYLVGLNRDGLITQESLLAKFDTQVDYLTGETSWIGKNWPFTTNVLIEQDLLSRFEVYEGWAGPERAAHVIGGDVLGIPTGVTDREREVAVALAEFLMSREAQETLAAENGWPSIRTDAYAAVSEEQQPTFDAIQAALEDGWYRPNESYWQTVQDAMNEALSRTFAGEPVKAVLDEMHAKIQAAANEVGATYPPE